MIAVDTNILVYAHRRDSEWHQPARRVLSQLADSSDSWAIPWPCIHEFYSIVTHPRIFNPPSKPRQALDQIAAWCESPTLVLIAELSDHFARLKKLVNQGRVRGPRVHDARIAAICRSHNIRELLTADRDFQAFHALRVRNPLGKDS